MTKATLLAASACAAAAALAPAAASAQAGTFTTTVTGAVQSVSTTGPSLFQIGQAGTGVGDPALNGTPGQFLTYSSTGSAPAITGNDLSNYGFALYATSVNQVSPTLVDYNGTFRIYAPGYGYTVDQPLETGEFSAVADFAGSPYTAPVTGLFTADPGFDQPAGWPVPVDFSGASPAQFTGLFTSDPTTGAQSLSGTLQTISSAPEPSQTAALGLGVLGLAGLILRARRRRAPAA